MSLLLQERQAVVRELAKKYKSATKKEKTILIDKLIDLMEYNRCHARYVLRNYIASTRHKKQKRRKIYGKEFEKELKKIWYILDNICGKRLAPYMEEAVMVLERHGELEVDAEIKHQLLTVSAATIDRILKKERMKCGVGKRSLTKPGTLLKSQIPIRTFADWNENEAGFIEMDLVGHEGGTAGGQFNYSLDVTDIQTCWVEIRAVPNKAEIWVFEALKDIRHSLPFVLKGVDSDNGSEFINYHLFKYCQEEHITFTRSRAGRKNDNCFVEQKNWSVVRRSVGYKRFDTQESCQLLNELYSHLNLYVNFFQPVMKLKEKIRDGSKVKRIYDQPRTPYKRVMEQPDISTAEKRNLSDIYMQLNPVALKNTITRLQRKLMK